MYHPYHRFNRDTSTLYFDTFASWFETYVISYLYGTLLTCMVASVRVGWILARQWGFTPRIPKLGAVWETFERACGDVLEWVVIGVGLTITWPILLALLPILCVSAIMVGVGYGLYGLCRLCRPMCKGLIRFIRAADRIIFYDSSNKNQDRCPYCYKHRRVCEKPEETERHRIDFNMD